MLDYSIRKSEDEILVQGLRNGCKVSLGKVYDNYSPVIFGIICKMTGNKQQAEDILRMTFVKVWNQITTFDSTLSTLPSWMIRIARSTTLEEINSRKKTEIQIGTTNNNVSEEVNKFNGLVTEIDPKELLDLIYYKGFCYDEIASRYSVTTDQVKLIIRNAVSNLKEESINEAE